MRDRSSHTGYCDEIDCHQGTIVTREIELTSGFERRLKMLCDAGGDLLHGGLKGIEKESLRVSATGELSYLGHPAELGSALTNKYITTDFSEALLEFVTPAFPTTWETLRCICDIHQFTYANLDKELLWPASMPCRIPADGDIPLARYGASNVGQMKTIYRRGLGYRYGRQMQTIAGVHFNYSVPQNFWPAYRDILGGDLDDDTFRSEQYLGLIRNFRRMSWLTLYLFGASPALCKSFGGANTEDLRSLNSETYFEPFGTSLRMSDLGYSNHSQSRINISLNSLDEYVRDLSNAIETPEPAYKEIGVKAGGRYRQLNTNLLQIENEFYSPVRPKRVANTGERPTAALKRGGIQYVEIRSLDINVFDPCGINQNTMRFMEAFSLYCLLEDSPKLSESDIKEFNRNQTLTAKRGRDPDFRLVRNGKELSLNDWGCEIMRGVAAVADQIDRNDDNNCYAAAVRSMQRLIDDPEETPSARIVTELENSNRGYFTFALAMATNHKNYFGSLAPLGREASDEFRGEATASLQRQKAIEASDSISLDAYLEEYFSDD